MKKGGPGQIVPGRPSLAEKRAHPIDTRFNGRRRGHSTRLHDALTTASIFSSVSWPLAKAWLAFTVPPL